MKDRIIKVLEKTIEEMIEAYPQLRIDYIIMDWEKRAYEVCIDGYEELSDADISYFENSPGFKLKSWFFADNVLHLWFEPIKGVEE